MKKILLLAMLALPLGCVAQATFTIKGFSDKYYGKLYISDTSEVFSEGWVAVYDTKTNKQLIKVEAEELAYTLREGAVKANVLEAPYGEQSVLMYDDFNFDGVKDFALMDGQNSCYHGPSFNIYLAKEGKFVYSPEFTRLAQEYCGMFQYDAKEKKISTMTKSGCCWHQFCEFTVENNIPVVLKEVEDDLFSNRWPYSNIITTRTYKEGKPHETLEKYINFEVNVPFSFQLENGKWVLFIDDILPEEDKVNTRYTFVDVEGKVELEYPSPDENRRFANFTYTEKGDNYTCSFSNGNAKYTVYDRSTPERRVGVKIVVNGKTYDLKGKPETVNRKLRVIAECDNVTEQ